MGLITSITGLITGSVGNNMDNHEDDVLNVKRNLNKAGYFDGLHKDPEPHGFITREMDNGIKMFQKDNGLKVDGILRPHGETENTLNSILQDIGDDIEKEELPPQQNSKKMIPGTNIPDEGVWEGEIPYGNRFDFKPDQKTIPIPQIIPPKRDIDPTMELPYDPIDKKFIRKYRDI